MRWRFVVYFSSCLLAILSGWVAYNWLGALLGVLLVCVLWFFADSYSGWRLLEWIKRDEPTNPPPLFGLWGELSKRFRRLLKSREIQILDSQARLHEFLAAIQASPNGVVLLDSNGRIEWCNQTAAAQFGFDAQRDLLQLIGNLVRDPAFLAYYNDDDYSSEVVIQARDSTPARPVKLAVHLHPYGEGRRLLLSRDVTAVEQAEAMRRDFVANVSHEIRTPLTVLSGFVETLQNLPLHQDERLRYLGLMQQQASRMQTLVSDLLTLSKLEGSPLPSLNDRASIHALLTQCEQEGRALSDLLTQNLAKKHHFKFETLANPAYLGDLAGNYNELLSAMSNLVSNAVRYTAPGGEIAVKWEALSDGRAVFSVTDSGPGIAPEHINRLTERFYRVDNSRSRETGGTGLGLAIVKHVVQRHGAELLVESAVGKGSQFRILFPAIRLVAGTSNTPFQPLESGQSVRRVA
ncbi:MAG: phosphate regulon sensor histidine kinase PhoR [Burkholderiaceae bacterium]